MNIVVQGTPSDLIQVEKILDMKILNIPRGGDLIKVAQFLLDTPQGSLYDGDIETVWYSSRPPGERKKYSEELKQSISLCVLRGRPSVVDSKSFLVDLSSVKECVECARKMRIKTLYLFVDEGRLSVETKDMAEYMGAEKYSQKIQDIKKEEKFSIPRYSSKSWKVNSKY